VKQGYIYIKEPAPRLFGNQFTLGTSIACWPADFHILNLGEIFLVHIWPSIQEPPKFARLFNFTIINSRPNSNNKKKEKKRD
jgi:hypothetical protein